MPNLAIIPARGGSKRIPKKNIKEFLGKPIISYSIERAFSLGLFDEIMVSTDDIEIANIAKQYGASVPFFRSPENSDDYAGTTAVLHEVLSEYAKLGLSFNHVCCIYPTAPLISSSHLTEGLELLKNNEFDVVYPIVKFGHPIQRALTVQNGSHVSYMWPDTQKIRTQDFTPAYHDVGQWYWLKSQPIIDNAISVHGAIIIAEDEVQDIDDLIDWKLAELKYKLLYG